MVYECQFGNKDEYKFKNDDKVLCCGKIQVSKFKQEFHLCNPKQQDRFCGYHVKEENYLISLDKIITSCASKWKETLYATLIDYFHCYYCHNLPRTPMICANSSCGALFCKSCCNKIIKSDFKLCPSCCLLVKFDSDKQSKYNRMI